MAISVPPAAAAAMLPVVAIPVPAAAAMLRGCYCIYIYIYIFYPLTNHHFSTGPLLPSITPFCTWKSPQRLHVCPCYSFSLHIDRGMMNRCLILTSADPCHCCACIVPPLFTYLYLSPFRIRCYRQRCSNWGK